MKKAFLMIILAACFSSGFAQLNMSLLSQVQYDVSLNDVWGWAAGDGTEYALVGVRNGVSIVSLADPENAVEVAFVPGQNSIWRDIKTWGDFAYVTTDQGGTTEGLLVIDLSDLPNSVSSFNWRPDLPGLGTLNTCHNLYIDENGYCYLSGCNLNSGGMLFVDVFSVPGNPIFVGSGIPTYSHDVYVRDNFMYASEIGQGRLAIYDVTDKLDPVLLATQTTPSAFTHNSWLSDDGNVVFTTDERANAPVAAYDISDLDNIVELDRYLPIATLGEGVIPHNVHVWSDWLVISYYTDGGIIVDASRPTNLIEVGNFDTFLGGNGGFSGAWGLYPFLPSGIVLVSDIGNGLYVLDANYVRACYLEGTVTDAVSGLTINGVSVNILSEQANLATTDNLGIYRTGQAIPGIFDVVFTKFGYESLTAQATLENGVLTILDVQMIPLESFNISGQTIKGSDGSPLPGAKVIVTSELITYEAISDGNGNFFLNDVYEGNYDILSGSWGYLHQAIQNVDINANSSLTISFDRGYQDDFFADFGWVATADPGTTTGFWDLGEPIGTSFAGIPANPDMDIEGDLGRDCYVTGNGEGDAGSFDIDNGNVYLSSPLMDLSGFNEPILSYNLWFFNGGGNPPLNDTLSVVVSNGSDEIVLERITQMQNEQNWRPRSEFNLSGLIELTEQMTISFETGDQSDSGHLVEAAVDAFLVIEGNPTAIIELDESLVNIKAFPNPFAEQLTISYQLAEGFNKAFIHLYNYLGQRVESIELGQANGQIRIAEKLLPGIYLLQLEADGKVNQTIKVIKI